MEKKEGERKKVLFEKSDFMAPFAAFDGANLSLR